MLALVAMAGAAEAADGMQARVMVLPSEGAADRDPRLAADVSDALMRGARRATPNVARANASLADTAVIVGCDPAEQACADAVAAALNVDQMLLPRLGTEGDAATVEVTAISRESAPVSRRFTVRPASRRQDLAAIEAAVPGLLDAEAAGPDPADPVDPGPADPVDPGPADPGPAVPGPVEPPTTHAPRGPMYVAIGGGAAVAVGLAFWGLAAAKQGAIDDAPTSSAADLAALTALEDRGRTYATLGNAFVIGGGIVAIAGGVWWWRTRPRETTVTPVVTPDGGAVMLRGTW